MPTNLRSDVLHPIKIANACLRQSARHLEDNGEAGNARVLIKMADQLTTLILAIDPDTPPEMRPKPRPAKPAEKGTP